jgi:hypothetical protein
MCDLKEGSVNGPGRELGCRGTWEIYTTVNGISFELRAMG